ncbi:MAG: hypothetical protein U1E25_07570 [Methylocystis sp.]
MAFAVKNHVLHQDDKPVAQKPTPNVAGVLKPGRLQKALAKSALS